MLRSLPTVRTNAHFPIMTAAYALSIAGPPCPGQPHSGDIL